MTHRFRFDEMVPLFLLKSVPFLDFDLGIGKDKLIVVGLNYRRTFSGKIWGKQIKCDEITSIVIEIVKYLCDKNDKLSIFTAYLDDDDVEEHLGVKLSSSASKNSSELSLALAIYTLHTIITKN